MPDPVSFDDLMSADAATIKRPPTLPAGTWSFIVKEYSEVQAKSGTRGIQVEFQVGDPEGDVDDTALNEFLNEGGDPKKKTMRYSFWITRDAAWRLADFLRKAGVDVDGKTFKQALAEVVGCSVMGYVAHTPSRKAGDDSTFAEITSFTEVAA